jgi:hypothetical protein
MAAGAGTLLLAAAVTNALSADIAAASRPADETATLQQELYELEALRSHGKPDWAAVDKKAGEMLTRWTQDADRGDIYFTWARDYAQTGIDEHKDKVLELSRKALALEKDPAKRAELFMNVGIAELLKTPAKERDTTAARARVVEPLLTGLKEVLELDLPEQAPELPAVGKFDSEDPKDWAKHAVQMEARKKAVFERDMVQRRDNLVKLVVEVYVERAHTPRGAEMDELKDAANSLLKKPEYVKRVMDAAQKALEKRKDAEKPAAPSQKNK